ncbi:hypothetical protein [uncultured Roseibium sp.]|uniref:hypothetical protein n=1 Tax=uncultured Roseibium sp. TaxID=1936171 RepID=UPI00260C3646|nr:hypothetical protein [uncultured Roseibium sp.]
MRTYSRDWYKERLGLIEAFARGEQIEIHSEGIGRGWVPVETPIFNNPVTEYRIKPKDQMTIDWSTLEKRWKYVARDKDGCVYAYLEKPTLGNTSWHTVLMPMTQISGVVASLDPGEVNWTKSLIKRPPE